MRTPIRHVALLLAAALAALGAALATGPGVGELTSGRPGPSSSPEPGALREGRLATPAQMSLCAQTGVRQHRGEPPSEPPAARGVVLQVPILAYHYVRTDRDPSDLLGQRLSVTPGAFAAQMDLLRRAGAHAVTLDDLVGALRGDVLLPAHAVVITVDDGYADFLHNALPVLQRDRICATLFAVPHFLGRPSYLTANQLREVAAAGVRIGAHTMDHLDLATQPAPVVAAQVSQSADVLRALTGQSVRDFAYPYGAFSATAIAAVQAAGFDDAVILGSPLGSESDAGRFTLPRREVLGGESLEQFAADAGVTPPTSPAATVVRTRSNAT